MSKYAIRVRYDNTDIPTWAVPEIEKVVEKQEREFEITFDRLEYADHDETSKYLLFEIEKKLKDYTFEINGQASVDNKEKTVSEFYGIEINLFVGSEEIRGLYYAHELSGIHSFMEYAETPEFDEYVDKIIKNKQLIRDLEVENIRTQEALEKKIDKEE